MTFQELHERLLSWASEGPRAADLLAAKGIHYAARGEPHEEDRSFEVRVNTMLDFYLYDWRPAPEGAASGPEGARSTLERFLGEQGATLSPEDQQSYRELAGNLRGLFEIRKLGEGAVRVRDVFTGVDHEVTERRTLAGVEKGDLLEARLLPHHGQLLFSGALLYQPREARKAILAEVKRLKKAAGKQGTPDVSGFLDLLARMAMKVERYRNVRLESIYDFTQRG
ncbi:MAG: hypothetical protein QM704_18545 [Anaeromyxobacteraceae bacterium]